VKLAAPQVAIFLDLETTGLYPLAPGAAILEIGMLAVEVPKFREIDSWSSLVVELDRLDDPLRGADDYVRKMHTENGLEADLKAAVKQFRSFGPSALPRLFDVQQAAIAFYNKHASGQKVYMGGAKPAFDRGWLDHQMPQLAKKFHYRDFDTNAFFILREYMFGAEKGGQKHRVLDDCRQAVRVVHEHFELMQKLFGPKAGA
jgi:oligoribonuclease (3'-5' exoribonuclease)